VDSSNDFGGAARSCELILKAFSSFAIIFASWKTALIDSNEVLIKFYQKRLIKPSLEDFPIISLFIRNSVLQI
jgi:hypothetical protein